MRRLAAALWLRVHDETDWGGACTSAVLLAVFGGVASIPGAMGAPLGVSVLWAAASMGSMTAIFHQAFTLRLTSSRLALREAELDRQLAEPEQLPDLVALVSQAAKPKTFADQLPGLVVAELQRPQVTGPPPKRTGPDHIAYTELASEHEERMAAARAITGATTDELLRDWIAMKPGEGLTS